MNSEKIMLIDGNSILNRAFYGLQGKQLLATSDGLYTNAVFGFLNILHKYLEEEKPDCLCVAFDLKAPTFRHKEFADYKANRKGMPQELAVQVPVIKEVLDAMNIKRLEYEGYEADDILGSVSLDAEKKGMQVIIVTGDRDSLQLASNSTRIKIPITRSGKTETEEYDKNRMMEQYGVTPEQFIDVKGLMGDKSDNIPGVPGIGEKTAYELIKHFCSIESIYENIEQVEKKSVKEKLIQNREMAFQSKRLATIERNMPAQWDLSEFRRTEFNEERLYELFKRLEFRSFIDKFKLNQAPPKAGTGIQQVRVISRIDELKRLAGSLESKEQISFFYLMDRVDKFKNAMAGLAIAWESDQSVYIDLKGISEEDFVSAFKKIFEKEDIRKVGHDLKNLFLYLRNHGVLLRGVSFDTMIAAYILNPSRETYTVSELASEYLEMNITPVEELAGKGRNLVLFKDMDAGKIGPVAVMHSLAVLKIYGKLDAVIRENGQEELYYKIELPLVEVLASMEYYGFKVNMDRLKEYSVEIEEKIHILINDIYSLAGQEFNINSTKQLGVILFEKLNLPVLKKTKTGYSTDAAVLEELSEKHEIVSKILEYRQLVKLKSTYVEGLTNVLNPATGRIHSSFNQTVTATGRISSTEPNLQNIPIKMEIGRKIRKVFVPENEGYLLMDADYSQIELRVLAHITNDENMIHAFIENEDIHTATAAQIFGVARDDVTPLMRSSAKTVNFGIVYGIGDFSLAKDLGITRKQARRYIDGYLDKYPNVRAYMHDIIEQGKTNGYVTTLFQRRRYLPELASSNFNIRSFGERVAMNTPIQGSAADIIKIAMVKVYQGLTSRKLASRLILQVHDELILEVRREEQEEVAGILQQSMEQAVKLHVPLVAEIKTGSNWYETK